MRVIAGKFRSRVLEAPVGLHTRPTADRLRETLFNVMTQGAVDQIVGKAFLDLYAGSGAVGIEALSRGATTVTFVEQAGPALQVLKKNLEALKIAPGDAHVEKKNVTSYLREVTQTANTTFAVIFLDPPYEMAEEYATTLNLLGTECLSMLAPGAIVVAEHRRKVSLEEQYGRLVQFRIKAQGDAGLSFYSIT